MSGRHRPRRSYFAVRRRQQLGNKLLSIDYRSQTDRVTILTLPLTTTLTVNLLRTMAMTHTHAKNN